MEYAAVIIPTLNRKKHLERCVNSLKQGKLASKTDLYISVDYPPSEKYHEGYADVVDYVKTIKGFANIYIFFQKKNLGPGLNRKYLEDKLAEKHDKYVFTDDDNEFSLNYLEYVNWGLEKFKDDESIYAICSCTDFEIYSPNNDTDYFMNTSYNPYGSGHWIHKNIKCSYFLVQKSLNTIYKTTELQNRLFTYSPMVYMWVAMDSLRRVSPMRGKTDNLTYIDIWENVYIIVNNMKCIKPVIPKSRNWGLDGSGVHVNSNDVAGYIPSIELDKNECWCEFPTRMEENNEVINEELHQKKFCISKHERNKSKTLYTLNAMFGNRMVYGVYGFIRKIYRIITRKENLDEVMYG